MKDANDIMVCDIKKILDTSKDADSLSKAISIMYQIRNNKDKYFRVFDVEA